MKAKPARMARNEARRLANEAARIRAGAATGKASQAEPAEPADRDGLVWLGQKRRLTAEQLREAFVYRDLMRDGGEVSLRSALEGGTGGGSAGPRSPSPLVSLASARRELLVLRMVVLRGQCDMLTAMDGVCGAGHTLRYLAGNDMAGRPDKHRARDLEVLLKAALDLIVAFRNEPKITAQIAR